MLMETDDFDLNNWVDHHPFWDEKEELWQELTNPQDIKEKPAS
jgi:hypothetical protein